MTKKETIKVVVSLSVAFGIGVIVKNAINSTTPIDISPVNKVAVAIGSVVLTGILGNIAADHICKQIDELDKFRTVVVGLVNL